VKHLTNPKGSRYRRKQERKMADQMIQEENERALRGMTKDQEEFLKKRLHLTKQELIEMDEDQWEEVVDQLFDMEIENENRSSAKTAKTDKIVSDLISMMTDM
jgi:hypothetical protein